MDAEVFGQILTAVRREMTAEQVLRTEAAARETSASKAVSAMLGEKTITIGETRRCQFCEAPGVIKWGYDRRGNQRFKCKADGCHRLFTAASGTPLSGMHMPEKWLSFAGAVVDRRSLTWIAENLGVSRKTAFAWRKRLLGSVASQAPDVLGGVVEADETFFLRSFKGNRGWKRGTPPENRPPRYRGSGAIKRGLSGEQVPVLTALDNSRHIVQAVLLARRDAEILAVLENRVEPGSVICSDGLSAYPVLAARRCCEHRVIAPPAHTPEDKARGLPRGTPGALGLGRVNNWHENLKTSFNRVFRGVSTRLLPNYLAMERTLRSADGGRAFLRAAVT